MPKVIIDRFDGGLSVNDRNIPTNQFSIGEKVDIHTKPGYILPSLAISTLQTTAGEVIDATPINVTVDSAAGKAYFIDATGKLYQMTLATEAFNANFDGSSHYYYAIPSFSVYAGGGLGNDLIVFNSKLIFSYNTANHAYAGTYDLTSTFTADDLDLGTDASSIISPHPMIDWNGILWIGNGRYLAKSTDGASATSNHLDLGAGWEITALFSTNNYIGICAWKKGLSVANYADCRVFFYDGVSSAYAYFIPIQDNKIFSAINFNGKIYLSTFGRNNTTGMIGELTEVGLEPIKKLKLIVNGTTSYLNVSTFNGFSVSENKLLMAGSEYTAGFSIFCLGKNEENEQVAFSFPQLLATSASTSGNFAKHLTNSKIYIGWSNGGTGTISYINLAGTSYNTATYKSGYYDFGQKVRVNYVKFYFKPLVSGDSVTAGLDTDYGTTVTLKDNANASTISYTADGAITSKKFKVGRDCHAFRPTLSWTAGGTAFSKIVVDYDFILDN